MKIDADFSELFRLFSVLQVEYASNGGYALAFHCARRYTEHLELLVSAGQEKAEKILDALRAFVLGESNLTAADFAEGGTRCPSRPRTGQSRPSSGHQWSDLRGGVEAGPVDGKCGDGDVSFIGREEFVRKEASAWSSRDPAEFEAGERYRAPLARQRAAPGCAPAAPACDR